MATSATAGGPGAHGIQAGGDGAAYGLCYGTKTSHPRKPAEVVKIYRSRGISKMWLSPAPFSPTNKDIISIMNLIISDPDLKSKIKIVMCIDYTDLPQLADYSKAKEWVNIYINNYASIIGYVCVGDVIGSVNFPTHTFNEAVLNLKKLLPVLIKLSIIENVSILLGNSYRANMRPSTCVFTEWSKQILDCLSGPKDSPFPLFVRIMPYFMISSDVPIDNCILKDGAQIYMHDNVDGVDYPYRQAFDAMLDSICCALKAVDRLGKVDIHVVSGWPTAGTTDGATDEYAKQYITNLIQHIGKPTPMSHLPVDIFINSVLDEDKLETSVKELHHLGAEPNLPKA